MSHGQRKFNKMYTRSLYGDRGCACVLCTGLLNNVGRDNGDVVAVVAVGDAIDVDA